MALSGQASGGWTESSSALRILHVGIRNTVGDLTTDAFTQVNPVIVTGNLSSQVNPAITGVLSGSVAFTRPPAAAGGSNEIGGPWAAAQNATSAGFQGAGGATAGVVELGIYINNANGNAYENQPGVASNKGPYVSGMGTYGNKLFESEDLSGGGSLTYAVGDDLYASCNGFLTNGVQDDRYRGASAVIIGILKMPPDSVQDELVFDQRI
jgi:hypothetical protein